jgi:hypothetical protein
MGHRAPLTSAFLFTFLCAGVPCAEGSATPRVAAIVTEYRHNAHADVIVSRLVQGHTLDGQGEFPKLELVSLYTDQVPENDTSRAFAEKYGFTIYGTVAEALTLGTGELAVDGVLLVAEHGEYPKSETGQTVYPKRRLFAEVAKVFEASGRSVPVFLDKHVADNWDDAKWIYDVARRLKVPLMAGSSLPVLWRYPPADVRRGAELKEIVAVSYHTLDAYGFHALEMVQCLAERRAGGETGIKSVECLVDEAVSTIQGHVHRVEEQWITRHTRNGPQRVMAASPGCLCRIDGVVPSYGSSEDAKGEPKGEHESWQHGFAIVYYHPAYAHYA